MRERERAGELEREGGEWERMDERERAGEKERESWRGGERG